MNEHIVRRILFGLAVFQSLSTLIGFVQLLFMPHLYEAFLRGTVVEGQFILAAVLLGVVVGGFQWAAVWIHLRSKPWLASAHALAGLVMLGWIAGECLVLGIFIWPHALWGGIGALQLFLVTVYLGAFQPERQFGGVRPT